MKREEIEKLIDWFSAANAPGEGNAVMIGIKKTQIAELVSLARLGASVMAPTEAEVERMAKGICKKHADSVGELSGMSAEDYWKHGGTAFAEDAQAALAALKDSTNV